MKKKILYTLTTVLALALSSCTDGFESFNQNPYEIQDASLQQDFNFIGAYYPAMLRNIFGDQIEDNLVHESFLNQLGTPTPFVGNRNNTTYYITWNTYWDVIVNNIMSPSNLIINKIIAGNEEYIVFENWAKLIRVIGASRLSAFHGPIIYTNYGKETGSNIYDSEETLYTTWFKELDDILVVFNANKKYTGLTKFDPSYSGKVENWIKVVNSWRLILAMRISKVKPDLAKTQGEKAIADPGGLIVAAADEWYLNYEGPFRPGRICFGWGDTRMGAGMESILGGYEDPRAAKLFEPATDSSLFKNDHIEFPFKGIQAGAYLNAKDDRLAYSTISNQFNSDVVRAGGKYGNNGLRRMLMASDVYFTLAEASLRNWAGAGDAKDNYEKGVRASFLEWAADGVDAYLNGTTVPWDYIDPKEAKNNWVSRITTTVKWDDAADDEERLEKIITQKWIAAVHNNLEVWCDHRRTGYPKLPFVSKNDSNADWGVIPANEFIKRMPFVGGERSNNPTGVADATEKLGGEGDVIGTRLWWDTGSTNNFPN